MSHRVLPGFPLAISAMGFWLLAIVLLPLASVFVEGFSYSAKDFFWAVASPRVLSALRLTFGVTAAAALAAGFLGFLLAWVLVRYSFFGHELVDALIDLPFSLPTAVSGLALTALYTKDGWLGEPLSHLGIKVAYTPLGIGIALFFVGLPFVVRALQPVLQEFNPEIEEAAASLGASRPQTFIRVVLPSLGPAIATGFSLAFARGLGEYGSVVFIAGNIPYFSEIAPLLIMGRIEQFDYGGATALASVMLLLAFAILWVINRLQTVYRKRIAEKTA